MSYLHFKEVEDIEQLQKNPRKAYFLWVLLILGAPVLNATFW